MEFTRFIRLFSADKGLLKFYCLLNNCRTISFTHLRHSNVFEAAAGNYTVFRQTETEKEREAHGMKTYFQNAIFRSTYPSFLLSLSFEVPMENSKFDKIEIEIKTKIIKIG